MSQCFQKSSAADASEIVYNWERVLTVVNFNYILFSLRVQLHNPKDSMKMFNNLPHTANQLQTTLKTLRQMYGKYLNSDYRIIIENSLEHLGKIRNCSNRTIATFTANFYKSCLLQRS